MQDLPNWAKATVAIIGALSAAIVAILVALSSAGAFDDDTLAQPLLAQAPVPAAIAVDGADANAEPDKALELDGEAREVIKDVAADPEAHDFGPGLRGPDTTPVAQHEGPLATPNFPGCTTRILPTNWSDRVVPISQVDAIALHYTAGSNRPGLSDMDGLTGFASSPSAGVSWHFLIDAEGHCYYQVPLQKKAWAIAALNSPTVNIEVIGAGTEGSYPAGSAGSAKLRSVVRRLGAILDIPMRVGAVSNCHVTSPGIITHWMGGPCSGGHIDIKPYDLNQVVRAIAGCDARCKQAKVVADRKRRHRATHAAYQREGCRSRLHEVKLEQLGRKACRELKRRGHRQHEGIERARKTLRSLTA